MKRRSFLAASAAGVSLAMLGARSIGAAPESLSSVGVQLYTLRKPMAESVSATLAAVAEIGYRNLEFAGYFDETPASIRSILDAEGLHAPAMHVSLDMLESHLEATLEVASTIGHRYLIMPFLLPNQRKSIDDFHRLAENMNRWGERCNSAGLRLGYHNHDFEFAAFGGVEPYDVLLNETDPETVFFEMDLYWAVKAGKNPVDYFKKFPGRFPLWHLKDMTEAGAFADVGSGVIDFDTIFEAAEIAGYKFGFVEHDFTARPLESIRNSYRMLQRMGRA